MLKDQYQATTTTGFAFLFRGRAGVDRFACEIQHLGLENNMGVPKPIPTSSASSPSNLETRTRRSKDRTGLDPSQQRDSASSTSTTNLETLVDRDLSHVNDPSPPFDQRTNIDTSKYADEAVSNPLFPPVPTRYIWSTVLFYRVLSMILSVCFLVFVVTCAMAMAVPSVAWTILSWCQFKDPDRLRPFYILEKERRRIDPGKLKCDVGYYAQRLGLECHESQVETEDGFILTIQHIVDRTSGAADAKSIHEFRGGD